MAKTDPTTAADGENGRAVRDGATAVRPARSLAALVALLLLLSPLLPGVAAARDDARAETPTGAGTDALAALASEGDLACGQGTRQSSPAALRILCEGAIVVGVRDDYPGFAHRPAGSDDPPAGFEVDFARALATRLGLTARFETVTPATRLSALADGDVDLVVATMGHDTRRDRAARFLVPHYYSSKAIVVGPRSFEVDGREDLAGRTVCSTAANYVNSTLAPVVGRLMLFRTPEQLLSALEAGECTLIAQDDSLMASALRDPAFSDRFERKLGLLPVPWGAAMPAGTPDALAQVLEAEIAAMHRDGTLIRLARAHGLPIDDLERKAAAWRRPDCRARPETCHDEPLEVDRPLRVQLMSRHQPRYAGFYLADVTGLYGRAGLSVELLEGGPGVKPLDALMKGRADVALAWLGDALATRARGHDIVNIAQIMPVPHAMLVCRRDSGIAAPRDLAGKRIATLGIGDRENLAAWLLARGIDPGGVVHLSQADPAADLLDGRADCVTALNGHVHRTVIASQLRTRNLVTFDLGEHGPALLEDGLYVRRDSLRDPEMREALARFLAGTLAGWRLALEEPEEALAAGLMLSPDLEEAEQRALLDEMLDGMAGAPSLGLLDLTALDATAEVAAAVETSSRLAAALTDGAVRNGLWTHDLWYEAGLGKDGFFSPRAATLYYLDRSVAAPWFYSLNLFGTVVFALAGFLRAREREFDLWGTLILTTLPAVGGGTLRDILIGGERTPPFVFQDPAYMALVMAVAVGGTAGSWLAARLPPAPGVFDRLLLFADALGLAAFTVIGTKVALVAGLDWFWAPVCTALTCSGGGMLLDIVTGREPRTFQGEPYEELAIAGSLLMLLLLEVADRFEGAAWLLPCNVVITLVFVFALRLVVVRYGLRSPRLRNTRIAVG